MANTYALLFGYIAALASGKTNKNAVLQAIVDCDYAMSYVDSLIVSNETTFGSWLASQI